MDKRSDNHGHRLQLNMVATSDSFCNQVLSGLRRYGMSLTAKRITAEQDPGGEECDLWLVVEDDNTNALLKRIFQARPDSPIVVACTGKPDLEIPQYLPACDRVRANDIPQLLLCLRLRLQLQTEQQHLRHLLRHLNTLEQQFVKLADQADSGIVLVNQLHIQYCNQRFADLFAEHEADTLTGKSLQELVDTPKDTSLATLLRQATTQERPLQLTPALPVSAGPLQFTLSATFHQGQPCLLAQVKLASRHEVIRDQRNNTGKDLMTRLDNLPFFESRVEKAIAAAIDDHADSILLITRIERFQGLQESIGKAATLQVLTEIAGFLDTAINKPYAATRLAIDEFAVLLFDSSTLEAARLADFIGNKVNASLLPPTADQAELCVSIGFAAINRYSCEVKDVVGRARMNTGKGYKHRHEVKSEHSKNHNLLDSIRQALAEQSLEAVFQPVIPFTPDTISRFMVSARLPGHGGSELPPEAVAACANVHNLGQDIDRLLLSHLMANHDSDPDQQIQYQIPVNSNTLADDTLPRWLGKQLLESRMNPGQLIFQVSEIDLHSNSEQVCRFCQSLAELDCRVIISDFGSAMEPLPALALLTPENVQLDALLIRDLPFSRQQQQVIEKLIAAIHQQQVNVTVSNLDDQDLLPLIFELGVDFIHGDCLAPRLAKPRYTFPQEQQLEIAS